MPGRLQLSSGLPVCLLLLCDFLPGIAMQCCLSQSGQNESGVVNLHMFTHLCVALWQWLILGTTASGFLQLMN